MTYRNPDDYIQHNSMSYRVAEDSIQPHSEPIFGGAQESLMPHTETMISSQYNPIATPVYDKYRKEQDAQCSDTMTFSQSNPKPSKKSTNPAKKSQL